MYRLNIERTTHLMSKKSSKNHKKMQADVSYNFGITSVWREKHFFPERYKNILIIIMNYILLTHWCKSQTNNKRQKNVSV